MVFEKNVTRPAKKQLIEREKETRGESRRASSNLSAKRRRRRKWRNVRGKKKVKGDSAEDRQNGQSVGRR